MSESPKKFYLTTPIYYVNARPHIGHAYTTIVADVIARRHRLLRDDTFFLTGTDEHGQKIERSAAAANIPPQQFADQVSASFRALWDRMGITYNDYIRTTDAHHKSAVQKLFQLLRDRDAIYLSTYTGQYSVGEEMFVEGPPGTIGPDGRPTETVTEENYFFRLSAYQEQLINLIESGELAIQPEVRRNEVLSFLRGNVSEAAETTKSKLGNPYLPGALKDFSLSRTSVSWGVPVPGDEKHTIYVWFDALINYISAIGYGSDDPQQQKKFEHYWPADLHLVGKEIIRFHCVYWPAVLLAAGLPLPKAITAHGWLLFEDSKMSKSRGNIVRTETILDAFGTLKLKPADLPGAVLSDEAWKHQQDLFASDILRYFLLREIPFGQDGSFSFDALITRYNADLANGYGNLVSRTLNLIQQNQNGAIIAADEPWLCPSEKSVIENGILKGSFSGTQTIIYTIKELESAPKSIGDFFVPNLTSIIARKIGIVDGYLSANTPWKLAKSDYSTDRQKMNEVLYTAAESIRIITALLYPIMPYATAQVWSQLGLGDIEADASAGKLKDLQWGGLKPGTKLGPLAPIFPRAPKELIAIMANMENPNTHPDATVALPHITNNADASAHAKTEFRETPISSLSATPSLNAPAEHLHAISEHHTKPAPATHEPAPAAAHIAIDDFAKIDLRVARILVAERIPKADKLLRLEVDLGTEKRQILSGIAEWYTPEELIGRRIVVIANLAPRKMRGLESHGMLLAASHGENGKPILATFADSEEIALGSRLK